MAIPLDKFFGREDRDEAPDLNNISLIEVLEMMRNCTFDVYFDRQKILTLIKLEAEKFEKECFGTPPCNKCGSNKVFRIPNPPDRQSKFRCENCGRTFKDYSIVPSHFPNWVLSIILREATNGNTVREICKTLLTQESIEKSRGNLDVKMPDEKTVYDILERHGDELAMVNEFYILLLGGIKVKRLFIDDLFSHKTCARRHRKKNVQKTLEGCVAKIKRKKSKEDRPYFYPIVFYDPDKSFTIYIHPAVKRDQRNYTYACLKVRNLMKGRPNKIKGDELKSMINAVKKVFFEKDIEFDFKKLKPWQKGELALIERKIKDIRRTLKKSKKYASFRLFKALVTITLINENYLEPRKKYGGKSAATIIGIPYPFKPYDWHFFLGWIRYIVARLPRLLKASLKCIPGTPLKPE